MNGYCDFPRLARVATMSMALTAPAISTALAEDLYHPGQYDAFGADMQNEPLNAARRSQHPADAAGNAPVDPRAASNDRALDLPASRDRFDRIYNEIYRPGTNPPGW
jgi:hypothetical protein